MAVPVAPQVFDLRLTPVRKPGAVLTRDGLIEAVWGGRIVSDAAISARVSAARRAVGDDGTRQGIIRTLPRRGFQFVADVSGEEDGRAKIAEGLTPPKVRYATAEDGVKIAFAVSGSGPPLMRVAHHPTHLELDWAEETERAFFEQLCQDTVMLTMVPSQSRAPS